MNATRFRFGFVFTIMLPGIFLCGYSAHASFLDLEQSTIIEKPIRAELIFSLGSDKENEDFYQPNSIAVDLNERLFVLDKKNSRVQCFSKNGKFIFSFGKFGQGPGELSQFAKRIRILEDRNIYIIDAMGKIIVYGNDGKFINTIKVDDDYNDIEMIDGKYYLVNHCMEAGRNTITVMDNTWKKIGSFGINFEPEDGILKKINNVKMKEVIVDFFNTFPRIIKTNNKELIYSLFIPYRFIKYNIEGKILSDINGNIEYGNKEQFSIIYKNNYPFIMPNNPLPIIYNAVVKDDNTILVPFLKKERDYLYIDHYDKDFNFINRFKISERFEKDGNRLAQAYIDNNNNLYCLIIPIESEDPPRIIKFKLLM
jgi:hypothetical protein